MTPLYDIGFSVIIELGAKGSCFVYKIGAAIPLLRVSGARSQWLKSRLKTVDLDEKNLRSLQGTIETSNYDHLV